jgi:hypothetical protein
MARAGTFLMGFNVGGGNREDLLDMISNIDPWETPAFTSFPKTRANHVLHEWLTDTLPATSSAGAIEGADWSCSDAGARTRVQNVCQIFRQDFFVSNTQRAVNPAGIRDEYAYQVQKNLKAIARNIETRIFAQSGSCATGTTGAIRNMKGLNDFISTTNIHANSTDAGFTYPNAAAGTSASATAIDEDRFNVMLQLAFEQGGNPDKCFVNAGPKRQISAFSGQGASRRNIAMTEKKLVASVDVYDSDFGLIQIVLDRWVYNPATTGSDHTDLNGSAYFLETGMQRIAFLRPIRHVPLAPIGDSTRGMVLGELTLEVLNEKSAARLNAVGSRVE